MVTINVSNEAELRAAIFTASNDFAIDGSVADNYIINITADLTEANALTQSLPMIRGPMPGDGSTAITINGNGHTIDANNAGRVFFVESGRVAINDVTIANARAEGGDGGAANNGSFNGGGGGGGGGLGAGAAVFVNDLAEVTLTDVAVAAAASVGGSAPVPFNPTKQLLMACTSAGFP